jgi:hypothetical protein
MNRRPLVSVVIPSYNRSQAAIVAINSVLSQTYSSHEVVFVDDGSTDGTTDALERFLSDRCISSDKVRHFVQRNQGQSAARNKGIAEAKGEWIAFLDSDDTWLPEKLEWQVRAIQQFNGACGACFTDAKLLINLGLNTTAFQAAGLAYKEEIGIDRHEIGALAKTFGGPWVQTLIARTELIRQIGGFDPELHFAEDYDFLFRLFLVAQRCYVNIPLAVIDRRGTPGTDTCRKWDRLEFRLHAQQHMFEKWLKIEPPLLPDVQEIVRHNLRAVHSSRANWCLENSLYKEARQEIAKAMKYQFTSTLAVKLVLATVAPRIARKITPRSKAYSELT